MLGHEGLAESPLAALPETGGGAVTHDTSGALIGAGAVVAGSAAGTVASHDTTGALVGQGSTVAGSAARTHVHSTTGALSGQGSTLAGTAAHKATHTTTGALIGAGSVISGVATGPSTAQVGGGGWVNLPHYKHKTDEEIRQERIKLGIIPPDVAKVVVDAVSQAIEGRTVPNPEIDLAMAEKAAREAVEALRQQWTSEYIQLLSIEYARLEQENMDAQIAMLLFDM